MLDQIKSRVLIGCVTLVWVGPQSENGTKDPRRFSGMCDLYQVDHEFCSFPTSQGYTLTTTLLAPFFLIFRDIIQLRIVRILKF